MTPAQHILELAVDWDPGGRGPDHLCTWVDGERGPAGWNLVLWHGSGSDGDEPVLAGLATRLAARGHRVARPRLPFREQAARLGRNQPPDRLPQLLRAARATVEALARHFGADAGETWVLGGRSLGARLAAHLAAEPGETMPGSPRPAAVLALAYPLNPPRAAAPRPTPFGDLRVPLVAVQGGRDPFGDGPTLASALRACPAPTRVLERPDLDHGLVAPRRTGVTLDGTLDQLAPELLRALGDLVGLRP